MSHSQAGGVSYSSDSALRQLGTDIRRRQEADGDSFTKRRNNLITTVSKTRQWKGERSRQVEKFIWRGLELTCKVNIESST